MHLYDIPDCPLRIRVDQEKESKLEKHTQQIAALESKIGEAQNRKERAVARAQLTRSGFVYVISNVGSFGEKVYKIGMTRRMEPMDRIAELGRRIGAVHLRPPCDAVLGQTHPILRVPSTLCSRIVG